MSTDITSLAKTIKDSEEFITSAEQDLAAVGLLMDRLPEPERQKFLTMKAEIAHERDQLELAKRDLFKWRILQRAEEIRAEEARE